MKPNRTLALAGALAALAAAAAPAAATAAAPAEPVDVRSGRFLVQLEGVQKTNWSTRHAAQFECDVNIHGGGFENVWFKSRPTVLKVSSFGRNVLMRRGRAAASLDVNATIEREGVVETTGNAICADGDGGAGPPSLSDCGTKRSRLRVDVRYRRGRVTVEPDLVVPLGPFANCPEGGISWPSLLTRNRKGRPIGQALPLDDLFGHGRNIVVARGNETQDDGESQSATSIRWSLSFKRIGKSGRPAAAWVADADAGPVVATAAARATPAARATRYVGKTNAGDRISFVLRGGRVSRVRTFTPTSCVPTGGTPRAGTDFYEPPGRFPLGRTTKIQTTKPVDSAMHYAPVSKWFHFTARRGRGRTITGKLHQNYAFEWLTSDSWSGIGLIGWVCQGDASFTARPR